MDIRRGEEQKHWFRSDRFTSVNGKWYYQTREGTVEGPFDSMTEAGADLLLYLRHADDLLYNQSV